VGRGGVRGAIRFSFRRLLQYVAHHRGVLRHLLGERFAHLYLYKMPQAAGPAATWSRA